METLQISITLEKSRFKSRLRIKSESDWQTVSALIDSLQTCIEPRAVFRACYIDSKDESGVIIDGISFVSRVMRKNLEEVQRVFPHVVTLGEGPEELYRRAGDLLEKYWLDAISNVALEAARRRLKAHLQQKYALKRMSFMSPGSLEDFPLEEQRPLFSLLGDVEHAIGVRLTDSFLMIPGKTVSGIYFPTEIPFYSCQLCPRRNCPTRKAPYSDALVREYGMNPPTE